MFCRSSLLPYSDRLVHIPHECPSVDGVVDHVCTKGEKSPDIKTFEEKRSRRSSLSRFVKFLSCSGKSKKTQRSASKCNFLKPHTASDGEHLRGKNVSPPLLERVSNTTSRRRSGNDVVTMYSLIRSKGDVVFGRASSSVADVNMIAKLYDRDLSDVDDCVSPSKHRRLSLPIGFTPELCEDNPRDRQQHSLVSDTPGSVSQHEEISRSSYCRKSRRRMTPARKLDAMLLTLRAPLTPKKETASSMHLCNYVVEPWSKHLQNQIADSSSKHVYNQAVDSSSKHLYNQAVNSCSEGQKQLTLSSTRSSKKCFNSLNLSDKQMSQSRQHRSKPTDSLKQRVNSANDCPKRTVNSTNDCPKRTLNSANDCPKRTVNSANDCPKRTVNSTIDCPKQTVNSTIDCPKRTVNSTNDCPKRTVNSANDCPKRTVNSAKDCPKRTVNSAKDCPKRTVNSTTDCPKRTVNSTTDCPKQIVNSAKDCSKQTVNSTIDYPKQIVNSAKDCSKRTVNSAKPISAFKNMAGGEVNPVGSLQNMGPGSQDHVDQAGRIASWAVHFDKLLQDPLGVNIFTKFLEKEFSDENMRFWQVCQLFRGLTDQQQQQTLAKDIYNQHIAARASDPVNVDSAARSHTEQLLDSPTSSMFDLAQNQIQRLMKLDSYPRFLKSDLYKNVLVEEMQGKIHPEPEQTQEIQKDKKQSVGTQNGGKRRRSLLPWMRFL